MGKVHTTERLRWTAQGTASKNDYDSGLKSTPSESGENKMGAVTFSDDKDGSDNWSLICGSYSDMTEAEILELHPAFQYVNDYASVNGLTGTDFETGWYMPALPELDAFLTISGTLNPIMELINGTKFSAQEYWSSSLNGQTDNGVWIVGTAHSEISTHSATNYDDNVCCVHQF